LIGDIVNEKRIEEIIKFSEEHTWKPQFPSSLVRRFLTELISSPELILEINDQEGHVAVGVLLDKVSNLTNDACLEVLGLRSNADVLAVFSQMITFAKEKTPVNRSGFQVGLSEKSTVLVELLEKLGLVHYYDTYEMRRSNLNNLFKNEQPEIVNAGPKDREDVYKVLCETFKQNPDTSIPDAETWKKGFLKSPRAHFYLWCSNKKILGFAALIEGEDGKETEIRNIGVLPTARGSGIGHHLLSHCLQKSFDLGYESCHLTVAVENQKALGLYLRSGFEITEKQQCFRMALR
jgi:ribosomal protein S18 acetylase RimI-like enzyme